MACISQTRISAGSAAVTRWPPVAVKRTASPASQRAGAFQRDAAPRDEQVQEGRLGQLHALAGLQPGRVQRGVPVLILMAAAPSCSGMPDATVTRPPESSSWSISSCS